MKGYKMKSMTVTWDGIDFRVWYFSTREKDPLGTGDSPTSLDITIESIDHYSENFLELLDDSVIDIIKELVIRDEQHA